MGCCHPLRPGERNHVRERRVRARLNPTTSPQGLTTKIGIDATVPFPRTHKYDRVKFEGGRPPKLEISDK